MKAAQLTKYQDDFKLVINNIDKPQIKSNEVLIKISYAAVNPLDILVGTGKIKLIKNYKLPQTQGNEISGVIEEVGSNVHDFKVGDEIYTRLPTEHIGGFAEYIALDSSTIAKIPNSLDLKTAVAAPLTGLTAIQALKDIMKVESGKTILIPGGSGSFGQLAVPIAKSLGLKVIVTGNADSRERITALGADVYLDYKIDNYWEKLSEIDYLIDTLGTKEYDHELSVMKKGGKILSLISGPNKNFAEYYNFTGLKKMLFSLAGKKLDRKAAEHGVSYNFIFVKNDGSQLKQLSKIIDDNKIVPAIDPEVFSLSEINDAIDKVRNGHLQGKVVIKL
ncbi:MULTISPECIES: NADP-dependent oxidoreductase [Lactobacillaceae]|uniref:NADP-dependent oxidoreductase n=1 Tax=Lactobacillaceae TaxID=33958 RepID=UPI000C1B7BEB|nr:MULTISPECIES: NADP-dependent oxidoreductase [Lactobacillaceae]